MASGSDWAARLIAEVDYVKASGTLGKSFQINRLFDYLAERSLAGEAPKEIEVAQQVFGLSVAVNAAPDATVRVNVSRLRKKLEEFAWEGRAERLVLPRGEYRLILVPQTSAAEEPKSAEKEAAGGGGPSIGRRWWPILAGGTLALLALAAVLIMLRPASAPVDVRLRGPFWRQLAAAPYPTLLIVGDFYMFGEIDPSGRIIRTIHDQSIGSREALQSKLKERPIGNDRFVDLNYFGLPGAIAPTLVKIMPLLLGATAGSGQISSLTTSRFTTDMLSAHNLVYVGLLSALGDLRDPLFEGSGFTLSDDGDTIVDRSTRRQYHSDWADPSESRILRRDYAYVASRAGPAGNREIVIAGTRDPALLEAAQIVTTPAKLDRLSRLASGGAFEALCEVRTFGPSNYASRLVLARPLAN